MASEEDPAVNALYGRGDLITRVFAALEKAGVDADNLTVDALGPIDELHIAGREHTLRLGRMAGPLEGMHIIDVGCGVGGPARTLAHHFGCKVTGIDVTEEFCSVGRMLTERTGLERKVEIHHGDATDLPFEDNTFDVAWMQHVALNIPDKPQLFREIGRVLRPEGKIALHEILAGRQPAIHFPVPWAGDASLSLLVTEEELQGHLGSARFVSEMWEDVTRESAGLVKHVVKRVMERGLPPLSPVVLLGPDYPLMVKNLLKNLEEDRLRVVQAVLTGRS
jgi:ubiquinone/menaquinone biosynthesis C-methylase UbiE